LDQHEGNESNESDEGNEGDEVILSPTAAGTAWAVYAAQVASQGGVLAGP
jgi:hypothetical protein